MIVWETASRKEDRGELHPYLFHATHLPSAESPSNNEKCNVSGPKKSANTVQVANQSASIPIDQQLRHIILLEE